MEVLIITRSVALQQGLGALLESLPKITFVKAIRDISSAFTWIEAHQPRIVLLDLTFSKYDLHVYLDRIRALSPKTQRILLVDHVEHVQWVPRFAEAILIKGIAPAAVAAVVNSLLATKGDEDEHDETIE